MAPRSSPEFSFRLFGSDLSDVRLVESSFTRRVLEERGRPGRGRMEKTYVNKTSTKNPKQHKALHVSLCFSCILILSFTDYLIICFVSR